MRFRQYYLYSIYRWIAWYVTSTGFIFWPFLPLSSPLATIVTVLRSCHSLADKLIVVGKAHRSWQSAAQKWPLTGDCFNYLYRRAWPPKIGFMLHGITTLLDQQKQFLLHFNCSPECVEASAVLVALIVKYPHASSWTCVRKPTYVELWVTAKPIVDVKENVTYTISASMCLFFNLTCYCYRKKRFQWTVSLFEQPRRSCICWI